MGSKFSCSSIHVVFVIDNLVCASHLSFYSLLHRLGCCKLVSNLSMGTVYADPLQTTIKFLFTFKQLMVNL